MWKCALVLTAVMLTCACGVHQPPRVAAQQRELPADDSLATFIDKVNTLSANVRPANRSNVANVEVSDKELAATFAAGGSAATAADERAVAELYRRRGIIDSAFDHYMRAVRLDRGDAISYEAMARIWRDWGAPHLALGDAYRAVYFAPESPVARNTLGTVLLAIGNRPEAVEQFQHALRLDNAAAYALINMCRTRIAAGAQLPEADACRSALVVAPAFLNTAGPAAADRMFSEPDEWVVAHFEVAVRWLVLRRFDLATESFASIASFPPVAHRLDQRAAENAQGEQQPSSTLQRLP